MKAFNHTILHLCSVAFRTGRNVRFMAPQATVALFQTAKGFETGYFLQDFPTANKRVFGDFPTELSKFSNASARC